MRRPFSRRYRGGEQAGPSSAETPIEDPPEDPPEDTPEGAAQAPDGDLGKAHDAADTPGSAPEASARPRRLRRPRRLHPRLRRPSPRLRRRSRVPGGGSRRLSSARSRVRGGLYHVQDLGLALGGFFARIPAAFARAWRAFWDRLSIAARRRLVAAVGASLALICFFALAVPNLPCQFPGGSSCPPPDDAEELVPSDALAYLHLELDPETEQAAEAAEIAGRLPRLTEALATQILARLPGAGGSPASFLAEVEPWFAGEAAVAVVPAPPGPPEQVVLLEFEEAEGAEAYADRLAAGTPAVEDYQGVEVSEDERGLASAKVEDFLVLGTSDGVRDVVDAAAGADGAGSLAAEETATQAREQLPDHRLAEAYLSGEGVEQLAGEAGPLRGVSLLLAPGASEGAAAALVTEDGAVELVVRSQIDPERSDASPQFFAAFPRFEPSLDERLSERTAAYLGIGDPERAVAALLSQATAQAPGIAAGFEALVEDLRRDARVDVEREFLASLGGEAAFALGLAGEDDTTGVPADRFLEFVADDVDEERARRALAGLQAPLAESVDPALGQLPGFGEQVIAGVAARSVRLSPALELTYAVFDGIAAIATDPAGIEELASSEGGAGSLSQSERFELATAGFEEQVSLIAYLDLVALVSLGEREGLAGSPAYAQVATDARSLQALGLSVRSEEDLLAADLRLIVGDRPVAESEPLPGE